MFSLFYKLTSGTAEIRGNGERTRASTSNSAPFRQPLWVRLEPRRRQERSMERWRHQEANWGGRRGIRPMGEYNALYYSGPWKPYAANKRQLPFKIEEGTAQRTPLLRSPDIKPGIADISRVKDKRVLPERCNPPCVLQRPTIYCCGVRHPWICRLVGISSRSIAARARGPLRTGL